jgi:hypothetical protein
MSTILVYRDRGERPFAKLLLDNGDRVQITLDAAGFAVELLGKDDAPAELLTRGDVSAAARIYAAFTKVTARPSPLTILTRLVLRLPSADDVRSAFDDALGGSR